MEQLSGGFTLALSPGAFPLSTDSMLLAHFARLPRQARVLDLGSGCGTLGLLLCAQYPDCAVTGIELDPAAHETALENIRRNGLTGRMDSICADMTQVKQLAEPGSFSCCVCNPPYFTGGPDSALPQARKELCCTLDTVCRSAAWALKYGGDFFIVHRPERLAQLCALTSQAGLEPKRLCLVRHDPEKPVNLVLLQCRKGGKSGLQWQELCLHNADGSPTEAYRTIYHL